MFCLFCLFVCLFNIHQIASPFPFIFLHLWVFISNRLNFFCLIAFFWNPQCWLFLCFSPMQLNCFCTKSTKIFENKSSWNIRAPKLLIFTEKSWNLQNSETQMSFWVPLLNRFWKLAKMLIFLIIFKKKNLTNFGCPTLKFHRCNGCILSYPKKQFEMESKRKTFIVSCFVLGTDYRGGVWTRF